MSRRPFGVLSKTLPLALATAAALAPSRAAAQAQAQPAQTPPAAEPAPANPPQTPEERIHELDQQLKILARRIEIEKEAAEAAKGTQSTPTAGGNGFEIRSADSAFRIRFRGYIHADSRSYLGDEDNRGVDTFLLRRARPLMEATLYRIFDFRLMTDFGNGQATVQDAYFDGRFAKGFNLRVGKQKPPVGQERLASAVDLLFIERALPTALVPNRDLGAMAWGDVTPWLAYQAGVFNGVIDGGSTDVDLTDSKDLAGRLVFTPFKSSKSDALKTLTVGVAGSTGKEVGTPAAPALAQIRSGGQLVFFRYRTDGTAANTTIADGRRNRASAHGQVYSGPIGLQAEYVLSKQEVRRAAVTDSVQDQAWQATFTWVLTGEPATGRIIPPRKVLDPSKGTWGAFEIVARVNGLTVDDAAFPVFANLDQSARKATAAGLGLNWHMTRVTKFAVNYEFTTFDRGAANGADRPDEHALFTRFQIGF
jgi:phosphate-selective porin OprO/OprP